MRYGIAIAAVLWAAQAALGQVYRYEAETGQPFGTVFSNAVAGYSGTGYVTGFDASPNGNDFIQLQVDVPDGLYEMWVGYRSQYGQKGYNFRVDAETGSGMFDQSNIFAADRAGLFNMTGGTNTLAIYQSWGYYDVDYLEFRPFTPPAILPITPQLSDSQAGLPVQALMNYLTSIYGEKTLAGHQHDLSKNLPFPSSTYLNLSGGLKPAIRSSDFIEYSPSRRAAPFNSNPRSETEQSIAWARENGGVVSMTWHWNAPANLVNTPCGSSCGPDDYPLVARLLHARHDV